MHAPAHSPERFFLRIGDASGRQSRRLERFQNDAKTNESKRGRKVENVLIMF
jgi:hypothetical protein